MQKVIVYTDGGSRGNPGNAGVGVVVTAEKGEILKKVAKNIGKTTNNFAEYEAVILAFKELKKLYGKNVSNMSFEFRMDSQLVQKQLSGEYQIKEGTLHPQFIKIWNMRVKDFPKTVFKHIPREGNNLADGLANEAMDQEVENRAVQGTLEGSK